MRINIHSAQKQQPIKKLYAHNYHSLAQIVHISLQQWPSFNRYSTHLKSSFSASNQTKELVTLVCKILYENLSDCIWYSGLEIENIPKYQKYPV